MLIYAADYILKKGCHIKTFLGKTPNGWLLHGMFFISAAKSNNHATLLKGEKYDDDSENSIREIEAICSIYLTCGFT